LILPPQRANLPANLQNPGSTIDTTGWGTPSAAYPSSTCNISNYFTSQKVRLAHDCAFTTDTHELLQLVLDITLCGDWAGVPAIYNATCSGGTTGVCVSFFVLSANRGLTPCMFSIPTTLSVQAVPTLTTPTSRSITFACTPSIQSLRLFQVHCIIPALAARPSRRALALALAVDQIPVLYSTPHHLSTCWFCCSPVHLQFLFRVVDRRRRKVSHGRTCPQTFFRTFHPFVHPFTYDLNAPF
jgi:hypothetical protein